jgi:hypothetical protein
VLGGNDAAHVDDAKPLHRPTAWTTAKSHQGDIIAAYVRFGLAVENFLAVSQYETEWPKWGMVHDLFKLFARYANLARREQKPPSGLHNLRQ